MDGQRATVRIGEDSVTALAVNCGGVGERTLLSIRPERVLIDDAEGPNNLQGRVLELIYLGDHIRCRMEVGGKEDFIVKVPNNHAHAVLQVGATASVGWFTEDCRALDAV